MSDNGSFNKKELDDIYKIDLLHLLSVILMVTIIKWNDTSWKWFNEDPIIGHDGAKQIMSRRKLLWIENYHINCVYLDVSVHTIYIMICKYRFICL